MTKNPPIPPPIPSDLQLKRNVMPIPAGLKVIYNFTDGTFLAEILITAAGPIGQQNIPAVLADLAQALSQVMPGPNPTEPAPADPAPDDGV